jgi:acylphosphatase
VTGYVLNLADGRVKLVIEGDQRRVEEFLSDVDTQMERYIQGSQIDVLTATGEFSQFNIVF